MRLAELAVPLAGLPAELAGLRIAHLADFHLGVPSPGALAIERAVDWVAERQPDLVLLTGDLLARPEGAERLRELIERLPPVYAVLGNHDFADSRDPFSKPVGEVDLGRGTLLGGRGGDARAARPSRAAGRRRSTHVPALGGAAVGARRAGRRPAHPALALPADRRPAASAAPSTSSSPGICTTARSACRTGAARCGSRIRARRTTTGSTDRAGGVLHVSSGLGTTFVPFRFFARPEATELILESA